MIMISQCVVNDHCFVVHILCHHYCLWFSWMFLAAVLYYEDSRSIQWALFLTFKIRIHFSSWAWMSIYGSCRIAVPCSTVLCLDGVAGPKGNIPCGKEAKKPTSTCESAFYLQGAKPRDVVFTGLFDGTCDPWSSKNSNYILRGLTRWINLRKCSFKYNSRSMHIWLSRFCGWGSPRFCPL